MLRYPNGMATKQSFIAAPATILRLLGNSYSAGARLQILSSRMHGIPPLNRENLRDDQLVAFRNAALWYHPGVSRDNALNNDMEIKKH